MGMKWSNKLYGVGLIFLTFGGAGLAEHITSSRGSFIISTIVFSIGLACVIVSYQKNE